METLTAPLSAALNSLFPRSPKGLNIPEGDSRMKSTTSLGEIHLTPDGGEKAEFRIEGMTCGACVEVFPFAFV